MSNIALRLGTSTLTLALVALMAGCAADSDPNAPSDPSDPSDPAAAPPSAAPAEDELRTGAQVSVAQDQPGIVTATFQSVNSCPANWATVVTYGTPDTQYGPWIWVSGAEAAALGGSVVWSIQRKSVPASTTNESGNLATTRAGAFALPLPSLQWGARYEVRLYKCWYGSLLDTPSTALQVQSRTAFIAH
jgi:hypothetical protein